MNGECNVSHKMFSLDRIRSFVLSSRKNKSLATSQVLLKNIAERKIYRIGSCFKFTLGHTCLPNKSSSSNV